MAKDILSNLTPAKGSRRKMKRIGRGQGSGHGKTATRGHKGAKARSGHKFKLWFEGGQMPLTRRVPKYGFKSRNREEVQAVNVESLERIVAERKLNGSIVNPEVLYALGLISKKNDPVKILGNGDLKAKLEVSAHAFSKSAVAKIEAVGGKTTVLGQSKSETSPQSNRTE
jgi:large subunit ribosomal protein L15